MPIKMGNLDRDGWIERIFTHGVNLTDWEQEFMFSVRNQFERKGKLSDKQWEIIERILTEKVP